MINRTRRSSQRYDTMMAYLMLSPALWVFMCFVGGPIVATMGYLCMTQYNIPQAPMFIGLRNFIDFFHEPISGIVFANTFRFVAALVPAHMVVGLILALLVTSEPNAGLWHFYRTSIYFPNIVVACLSAASPNCHCLACPRSASSAVRS